ncbi:MAG: hypothetical protein LBE20_05740 [Deltaproteobacteria bacterium]|jgi:hypothetical protein|nr:hypothetical protein [Deltaproteobacteria bacterium]
MKNFNLEIYTKNLSILKIQNPTLSEQLENTPLSSCLEILTGSSNLPVIKYQGILYDQLEHPLTAATTWAKRIFHSNLPNCNYIIAGFCTGYHILALHDLGAQITAIIEPNLELLKAALSLQDFSKILTQITILTNQKDFKLWLTKNFNSTRQTEFFIFPQALNNLSRASLLAYQRSFALIKGSKYIRPNILVFTSPKTNPADINTIVELNKPIKSLVSMQVVNSDFISKLPSSHLEKLTENSPTPTETEIFATCIAAYTLNLAQEGKAQIILSMFEPLFSSAALKALRSAKSISVTWLTQENYSELQLKTLEFYDYIFVCCPELLEQLENQGIYHAIHLPLFSNTDNSSNFREVLGYIYSDHFSVLLQLLDHQAWKAIHQELTPNHELQTLYQQLKQKALSPNLENLTSLAFQNPNLVSSPDTVSKFMFLYYLMETGNKNV